MWLSSSGDKGRACRWRTNEKSQLAINWQDLCKEARNGLAMVLQTIFSMKGIPSFALAARGDAPETRARMQKWPLIIFTIINGHQFFTLNQAVKANPSLPFNAQRGGSVIDFSPLSEPFSYRYHQQYPHQKNPALPACHARINETSPRTICLQDSPFKTASDSAPEYYSQHPMAD